MVAFVRDGRGQHRKLGGGAIATLDPTLSEEQREAALVIANSRDTVTELRGGAGTGKTRMMQATVKVIEDGGQKVFAFAPSAKASRGVLREEGFSTADTVEKLVTDPATQQKVRGHVLWIDEAGLLSTRDMKRVFDLAEREKCRIVLSGDIKQHSAVARGDALRLLEQEAGMKFAELKQVRRQVLDSYRKAVTAISKGETREADGRTGLESGIDALDKMGAIVEQDGDARYKQIAADYVAATSEPGRNGKSKTAIVVAPTHAEGEKVADEIREELKRTGRLTGNEQEFTVLKQVNLTEAQRGDAGNYRAEEIIQFHQNAKGFKRGERVTVTHADAEGVTVARANGSEASLPLKDAKKFQLYQKNQLGLATGDRLRITMNGYLGDVKQEKGRLNNGDVFEVSGFTREGDIKLSNGYVVPKDYGGFTQGYVATSHASQGTTVDNVFVSLGAESLAAANRQQFYVSVSRGRESVRIYTDDKEAMLASVKQDAVRLSASELIKAPKPKSARATKNHAQELTTLQVIQKIYYAIRARVAEFGLNLIHREEIARG